MKAHVIGTRARDVDVRMRIEVRLLPGFRVC